MAIPATQRRAATGRAPVVHARQHIIYDYMLRRYLLLKDTDRAALKKAHGLSDEQIGSMLWRSGPTYVSKLFIENDFARDFDLRGIAGFYFEGGNWLLNVKDGSLLLPYFTAGHIAGLMVYRSAFDRNPRPLTSGRMPQGSKAIPLR